MSVNKETKIGLAAILGLLVVFGVVLTWRLTRSTDAALASVGEEQAVAKTEAETAAPAAKTQDPPAEKATVLSPSSPFDRTARRPDEASQWATAGDGAKTGPATAAASAQDSPAPYVGHTLPGPPIPNADDRRLQPGDARQPGAALLPSASARLDPPASAAAGTGEPPKLVRGRPTATNEAAPAQAAGNVRFVAPPEAPPSGRAESDRTPAPVRASDSAYAGNNRSAAVGDVAEDFRETARGPIAGAASAAGLQDSGRTYTVQEGDTLFDIARQELGKAARWMEVYELNRQTLGRDWEHPRPGTQLALPATDPRAPVERTAGRGGETSQR
jgi:nucleoid-associated protein YgaU